MAGNAEQFGQDSEVIRGLDLDMRILARELYGQRDLAVVRRTVARMQSALALLTEALDAEAPERPAGPEPVYSPREAASRAARLGRYPLCQRHNVHGAKARYVPNLSPHSIAVAPASDHRTVRVEAWPVGTSDEAGSGGVRPAGHAA